MSAPFAVDEYDDVPWTLAATYEALPGDAADLTAGITIRAVARRNPDDAEALFALTSGDNDNIQITGKATFVLRLDPAQLALARGAQARGSALMRVYGEHAGGAGRFNLGLYQLNIVRGVAR
jgi:hypothetical protein